MQAFTELIEQIRATFFELRRISETMLGDLDCTGAERSLLVELDKLGARTVPQLARVRAVSRQAMQRAVDRVLERGWARAVANPEHERSSLIELAPAGAKLLDKIHERETALLAKTKLPLSQAAMKHTAAELAELAAALRRV
jgi:DNA-binding MarR family transcriptional regulator